MTAIKTEPFDELARDFWAWRAVHQPLTHDDIPRIERPHDWTPDWSHRKVEERRKDLTEFEERWKNIAPAEWTVPKQVDYRLIGSALARVRWELDITRGWQINPKFYVDHTLGAVFVQLLQPPPFDVARSSTIINQLTSIPRTVEGAKKNLESTAVGPFAQAALEDLKDIGPRLLEFCRELKPLLAHESAQHIDEATRAACDAMEAFRDWLEERLPSMQEITAVGRDAYIYFLKNVALMPFAPEHLLEMGRQEWDRSVAFEAFEKNRNRRLPELAIFPNQETQILREEQSERAIRYFLEQKNILTVPSWLNHYKNLPLPAYLKPLAGLGVLDDLTSEMRLKDDGLRYIDPPSKDLGYFELSAARDPRPLIVHEGIPGHYLQLSISWAHEDWIRRRYYDSGSNEGIGFYAEEMMLQAGLFDDSPRTREIMYNYMRLRALRVEVDVKLALGLFTIDEATDYLQAAVPMDRETARFEAVFFASSPGQAITYQIGKLQIIGFLADARRIQGEAFDLRAFHDYLWKNGNVPIALQRWEYLGLRDEIDRL
ncbi:MAG: DUF885 domain-containing protein [Blastocatellia bacterium]|nr:DUF885 domain-containing protein [Blastocatellia bacterium]